MARRIGLALLPLATLLLFGSLAIAAAGRDDGPASPAMQTTIALTLLTFVVVCRIVLGHFETK